MYIVIDIETTGLPRKRKADFKDLSTFDPARIVSLCYFLVEDNHTIAQVGNYIIKPDGFTISPSATAIHGISNDFAMNYGMPIVSVLQNLNEKMNLCHTVVCHNTDFDITIVKSEMYRYGITMNVFEKVTSFCTMMEGMKIMKVGKFPRLIALYSYLHPGCEMDNAHNAYFDTLHCWRCYKEIIARKAVVSCCNGP